MNLDDMFREEEERRVAQHCLETAAEKASWDALSDAERAAVIAAREAKWAAFADACEAHDDDDDDDDDDEEEEQDDMNALNEFYKVDMVSRAMLRAADAWAQSQIGLGLGLRPSPADCPIDVLARAAIDAIDAIPTTGAE